MWPGRPWGPLGSEAAHPMSVGGKKKGGEVTYIQEVILFRGKWQGRGSAYLCECSPKLTCSGRSTVWSLPGASVDILILSLPIREPPASPISCPMTRTFVPPWNKHKAQHWMRVQEGRYLDACRGRQTPFPPPVGKLPLLLLLTFFPPRSARLDSPCFPPRPRSDRLYSATLTRSEGCVTGRWQCTPQEGAREGGVGVLHVHTFPHLGYNSERGW